MTEITKRLALAFREAAVKAAKCKSPTAEEVMFSQIATVIEGVAAPREWCVPMMSLHCVKCGTKFETPTEVDALPVFCGACSISPKYGFNDFEARLPQKRR